MRTSRLSTSSTARWICEALVTSRIRGVTRLSAICSPLRVPAYTRFAPPSKRLIDEPATDAPVGSGDQNCLIRNVHTVLPFELSVGFLFLLLIRISLRAGYV